ncbi:adhesion G-protein coupled receptor G1-like [Simochromis diagramma]|uniref:adhesion G-protein coupled receptor G1-like n=1 Tax=Simochromis diagramma TaxID=43689 RepID=UPI001A7E9AC4|nr:adhesion G-protein coupled receptor G1-like [Simochromis diagramma]
MKWLILFCLVFFVYLDISSQNFTNSSVKASPDAEKCINYKVNLSGTGGYANTIKDLENIEKTLENININATISISFGNIVALLFIPTAPFKSVTLHASDSQAGLKNVSNTTVSVELPEELNLGPTNMIVFSNLKLPETNKSDPGALFEVYDRRMVILSVKGKNISGLRQPVNITMKFNKNITQTQRPSCHFLNFSTNNFSTDGCHTIWTHDQSDVTCSCNHFTYFGVLMVSASSGGDAVLSKKDIEILSYITIIGCSFSLVALVITVLLFITNRTLREDLSMNIHINLVIALILLNLHFLPSQAVAAHPSTWLCFYMALALHYSLLATFTWMALEGFHLYLLLVKIFNISVSRYILKLSVVGWGVPAVIVSVVVIIDRGSYGQVLLDKSNHDDTKICYISNEIVKVVTTTGLFTMVFLFNMTMFMVTVKRVLNVGYNKEFGQLHHKQVRKAICALLGVSVLLGITWGLVFFSFGYLTTVALYLFCVLNSLQGFFIFLWFVKSLRKGKSSAPKISSEATSPNRKLNKN